MNVRDINKQLATQADRLEGLFPHAEDLKAVPFRFRMSFGLDRLPEEPGVIIIRGPRQYGKSTWLETQIIESVRQFGPGTAFYLNGDEIVDAAHLVESVRELVPLYRADAPVRRLFIDEITTVPDWQKALKRLVDGGELKRVLVLTTGSNATDLRHGAERLPGRKGTLDRTTYIFTPVAYAEFRRACSAALGTNALHAYLLTGGSPIACAHIAQGRLPEHVIETVKDWIYGECARAGRDRSSLLAVIESLLRHGGTPSGQARLARDAGLANNTVAQGYVRLLADLMCLCSSYAWDAGRRAKIRRKPCKYHFCNTLVVTAWHPGVVRTVADFNQLPSETKGQWYEWAVAQELWRRAAIAGRELPEELNHWESDRHALDFVLDATRMLEVKLGATSPMEFAWFSKVFPKSRLNVICQNRYQTEQITTVSLEDFLLEQAG